MSYNNNLEHKFNIKFIFLLLIIYMIINKIYYGIIFLLIIFIIYYQVEIKKILNINNFNISFIKNNIEKFINKYETQETPEIEETLDTNKTYTDMFNDIDKLENIARNNKTVITPFKNMVSELRNKFNIVYNKLNE